MAKRKTNSPWGSAYKEGLPSTAVNDRVEVDEILYPSVNTGNIDVRTGQWEGVRLSDKTFTIDVTHAGVANGANVLSPQATPDFIDMTGYTNIFIGLKPTNAGSYSLSAVMGPNHNAFANLSPVNAATILRGVRNFGQDIDPLFQDAADTMSANVWNIFIIRGTLVNQKLLQFNIVNNSGGESDIQFAYLRVV